MLEQLLETGAEAVLKVGAGAVVGIGHKGCCRGSGICRGASQESCKVGGRSNLSLRQRIHVVDPPRTHRNQPHSFVASKIFVRQNKPRETHFWALGGNWCSRFVWGNKRELISGAEQGAGTAVKPLKYMYKIM